MTQWLVEVRADGTATAVEYKHERPLADGSGVYLVVAASAELAKVQARRLHANAMQRERTKELLSRGLCKTCGVRKVKTGAVASGAHKGRPFIRCSECLARAAHESEERDKGTRKARQSSHDNRVRLNVLLDAESALKQHETIAQFAAWLSHKLRELTAEVDRFDNTIRPRRNRESLKEHRRWLRRNGHSGREPQAAE